MTPGPQQQQQQQQPPPRVEAFRAAGDPGLGPGESTHQMPLPPSREMSDSRPVRGGRPDGSYSRLPFSFFFRFCFFSFCFCFCSARGLNPAFDPGFLLLLGGDVERNPGPRCSVCFRALRGGQTPLACALCGALCHRQTACSDLTRAQQRVSRWRCRRCCGGGGDGASVFERALSVVESDVGVDGENGDASSAPPTWVPVLPVGPGCAVAPAPCVVRGVGVVAMRFLVVVVSGGDIVRRDGGVLGVEAPLP